MYKVINSYTIINCVQLCLIRDYRCYCYYKFRYYSGVYLLQINAKIFFIDRKCNVVCEKGSLGLLGKLRLIYIQ